MNVIIAVFIFSFIIVVHELGHFLLAKKNGIFVKEFSIGMGPRIISLVRTSKGRRVVCFLSPHEMEVNQEGNYNNTIYSLKLFPIGGSCIMLGEDEGMEDDNAYSNKSVWARISVTLAGPFFNFLLAFVLCMVVIGISGYDIGYSPAVINQVLNSPAMKSTGIKQGDLITNMNGTEISAGYDFLNYIQLNPLSGDKVELTYIHNGRRGYATYIPDRIYKLGFNYQSVPNNKGVVITLLTNNLPMENAGLLVGDVIHKINGYTIKNEDQLQNYFIENPLTKTEVFITYSRNDKLQKPVRITPVLSKEYELGFNINTGRQKADSLEIIKSSAAQIKYMVTSTVKSVSQLIQGKLGLHDMTGPVGVVGMIGTVYNANKNDGLLNLFLSLANMTILLSANLGVMNLLPLPALDGGRLVFLLLEVYRKKAVKQEREGLIHFVGLVALFVFMVIVMFNDVRRLI